MLDSYFVPGLIIFLETTLMIDPHAEGRQMVVRHEILHALVIHVLLTLEVPPFVRLCTGFTDGPHHTPYLERVVAVFISLPTEVLT